MRKNKFIKLIEHILVCLPLLMVLVTCCYTIWNSNANQSYYGDTINQRELHYIDSVNVGDNLYLSLPNNPLSIHNVNGGNRTTFVGIENVNIIENTTGVDLSNISYIALWSSTDSLNYSVYFYDDDVVSGTPTYSTGNTTLTSIIIMQFDIVSVSSILNSFIANNDIFYNYTYNDYSYLSSAFEYSLSEFNNMGFGKIDFTGFFVAMFHNGQTNVYIDFANSYLNYMLFIECTFVLPLVLYWFIHIGENILYKFEKGEW